jgi:hypothetical protein
MAFAMAFYSASVFDLDIVGCFRAHHEIRLPPINIAKPPVERRSSGSPAQSESEKALGNIDEDFVILTPYLSVCLTYLKMCFTTVQRSVVGACKN